jgi:Tn3 transposase DDE domain
MHPANRLAVRRDLESRDYRRRIKAQLNKGESLHALRDFLFVADKGVVHRKQEEAQTNQAMCVNLVTNAVVVWNTVYMQDRGHPKTTLVSSFGRQRLSCERCQQGLGIPQVRRVKAFGEPVIDGC